MEIGDDEEDDPLSEPYDGPDPGPTTKVSDYKRGKFDDDSFVLDESWCETEQAVKTEAFLKSMIKCIVFQCQPR